MIVEFIDGTTATIIAFVSRNGVISGTISSIDGYVSYVSDSTHIAIVPESGRPQTYTIIYPISNVLCVHKDITTLRDKKLTKILEI